MQEVSLCFIYWLEILEGPEIYFLKEKEKIVPIDKYQAFITQSGCTGGKRQEKGATQTRTNNLQVARQAT